MTSPPVGGSSVSDWLSWQEKLHSSEIELGLERVAHVAERMGVCRPAERIISVAGTNGKGSSVAFLASAMASLGFSVATYTSPHLLRYNERIGIGGEPISDAALCRAFDAVEQAREGLALTYFEYGTLAALWAFRQAKVDVAVLEVGLGGRLDAVNVVDADAALVTSIALDHQEWLGGSRDAIGREKAGIFRAGRLAVCADPDPPESIRRHAEEVGAVYLERGMDFGVVVRSTDWRYEGSQRMLDHLPLPALRAQIGNAAGCLALLDGLLGPELDHAGVVGALSSMQVAGRQQVIGQRPLRLVDVSHNAAAGLVLADRLGTVSGRVHAVVGMLKDKDHGAYLEALTPVVNRWYPCTTSGSRGLLAEALAKRLPAEQVGGVYASALAGWEAALESASPADTIVGCGSFLTVAEILGAEQGIG
ncbi:MAG: bifunctional tetrahydrofolate synthase/dihydrofolate synthase [Xanthomonadales bacterium]|nr:bifunctional tetrahydrofolate synthase/dihydrofolate synthase [Xanthomonadales bacterium]